MPMLPSGRHVAILLEPLNDLLEDALNVVKVHKVLAIQTKADLYAFTDVIWLLPESEATETQFETSFRDGSLPRPPGLVPVRSGYRLAQFDEFAADWSEQDKTALWDFIHVRASTLFDNGLSKTLEIQEILRSQAEGMSKLMVAWWDAGVHPAQEGYKTEEWDSPNWDTYDMLAALGQMLHFLNEMDLEPILLDDRMRLNAMWAVYGGHIPMLRGWPDLETTPRGAASRAREGKWLDAMDAQHRSTLHQQCVSECVMLWDHLGERLQAVFPDCAKIIDLVVVSSDANEVFDR